jgi:hypothetical protein
MAITGISELTHIIHKFRAGVAKKHIVRYLIENRNIHSVKNDTARYFQNLSHSRCFLVMPALKSKTL